MDIRLVLVKKLYVLKKYFIFFIFWMWIGYGFDVVEYVIVNLLLVCFFLMIWKINII